MSCQPSPVNASQVSDRHLRRAHLHLGVEAGHVGVGQRGAGGERASEDRATEGEGETHTDVWPGEDPQLPRSHARPDANHLTDAAMRRRCGRKRHRRSREQWRHTDAYVRVDRSAVDDESTCAKLPGEISGCSAGFAVHLDATNRPGVLSPEDGQAYLHVVLPWLHLSPGGRQDTEVVHSTGFPVAGAAQHTCSCPYDGPRPGPGDP